MRRGSLQAFVAAAALVAVLAPAAPAKSPPHAALSVRLAAVPLPKSSLGPAARGLKLAGDSGNSVRVERHQFFGAEGFVQHRLRGYALDYGNEASGRPGVDSVWTSVDEYAHGSDAMRALNFWRSSDELLPALMGDGGLSVMNAQVDLPAAGSARFGELTSYSSSNIAPVSALDAVLTDGRYLLHVHVSAGTAAEAKGLASKLVKRLRSRLELALANKLQAKPLKSPPKPKAGPPGGGPDLSALALTPSDFTGATLGVSKYLTEPSGAQPDYKATSNYLATLELAGPFLTLDQAIEWFANANEANFYADRWFAIADGLDTDVEVDLSSLGDGARGLYSNDSPGATALVVLSTGRLAEAIQVNLPAGTLQASDVTTVAQTAAGKIDSVVGG